MAPPVLDHLLRSPHCLFPFRNVFISVPDSADMPRPLAPSSPAKAPDRLTYIDLFAGCGGLSLGLHESGWEGLFAVERSPMAFETFKHNLIDRQPTHFLNWPHWFPKNPCSIQQLTRKHARELRELRGKVMLIAGGPPCQGFSPAGRRRKDDHRNQLYRSYLQVVELVRPALVLLENVTGITREFGKREKLGRPQIPYSERIKLGLSKLGYQVSFDPAVLASAFGVPQNRTRFVAVGIDTRQFTRCPTITPFHILAHIRKDTLRAKGLEVEAPVAASDALSDLLYDESRTVPCPETPKHKSGRYRPATTAYQRLMRGTLPADAVADSHRFVRHTAKTIERFSLILRECPRGKGISDKFRAAHEIKKAAITPMDAFRPSPTLTSMPDDLIHYQQPRVLTVRESARLQSFPDWFEFRSKYTTGGHRRKVECPRYTQVANAVPPLLAEALGQSLAWWIELIQSGTYINALVALTSPAPGHLENVSLDKTLGFVEEPQEVIA